MAFWLAVALVLFCATVRGTFSRFEAGKNCPPVSYFYYNFDWVLEGRTVATYRVPNQGWCNAHCINDKWKRCRSLNYQITTESYYKSHLCEINYSTKNRHPKSMKQRPGWLYEELKDADINLPFLDPVVVKTGKSHYVVEENSKVTIVCNATGYPKPSITWKKAGQETDILSQKNKLEFFPILLRNQGSYICNASNSLNTDSKTVKVTVVPQVRFVKSSRTLKDEVEVTSGSDIRIDCKGTHFSNVTWQREGGALPNDYRIFSNGTLVLLSVSATDSGIYVCKASTLFRSVTAKTQVKVLYRSCSHLKAARPTEISGNYFIDPDGEGGEKSFEVYCDMMDKNGIGVTVIAHDKETRERVKKACSSLICLVTVRYTDVTMTQLSKLTRINSYCEQFVMFECNSTVKFGYFISFGWKPRNGEKPKYSWGGSTGYDNGYCACGLTKTCANRGNCNCVGWGSGWQNDSGLLTNKSSLPVSQFVFQKGIISSPEKGYHTLGKFKCYGILSDTEPVKIYAPTSVKVTLSDTLVVSCRTSGRPKPLITWKRKDGKLLQVVVTSSEGISNLTFTRVRLYHNGAYICQAQNDVNTATAEIDLVVLHLVDRASSLLTSAERTWIKLDCNTNVATNITWTRRGEDLPRQHMLFQNGTLVLRNATTSYSGVYTCVTNIECSRRELQESLVIIGNLSCSHIKAGYPTTTSGNYTIDPDSEGGEEPFVVYCDMNEERGVTEIRHDVETRTPVCGCGGPGCYTRNVTYTGTAKTQLRNLIKISTHCEQFVMFECNGSVPFVGERAAWWVSRDGKRMNYWGGASPGSRKCACAMNNSCVGEGLCNCKTDGPLGWRYDRGKLTDIKRLPVFGFQFGGNGSGQSFYTLGRFRCYGLNKTTVPQFSWAMLTGDDFAEVWLNGKKVDWFYNNMIWNKAQNYTFEEPIQVIAVKIINALGPTGFLASFSDGSVTGASYGWKCIAGYSTVNWQLVEFDDSNWPKAVEFPDDQVKGISSKASWIRANKVEDGLRTFCRRKF